MGTSFPASGCDRFLRIGAVTQKTGLSVSSIYRHAAAGRFPRQARAGGAAVWSEREIDRWISDRLSERAS